ncbi:MAG: carbamoyltransferase HypF [Actinobacteria bacterium]|nr:carbamoyltransferase HypF [Actinomycetota bacterium]
MLTAVPVQRRRLRVRGTVQGVGFRPFVYRHALALGLSGHVYNDNQGVLVEVEGPAPAVAELCRVVAQAPPPLSRVDAVESTELPPTGRDVGFVIRASAEEGAAAVPVSVDTGTCAECLADIRDPTNRRYRYPFTNCTNCGPRYTIVRSVPYDRPATTMAAFTMCADCQREYDDPADRRFHAQPNACPACGPRLLLWTSAGERLAEGDEALRRATRLLAEGSVVAVKGIGGFHLATDATNEAAVAELRRRKARDEKPFAVMVPDVAAARELCLLDAATEAALVSPRRPIVLAPRRPEAVLATGVAPGLPELGLLLPYSPLHHLLLEGVDRPLVMTSGNRSDEPIAHDDSDAFERLGPLVDALLTHDRAIHIRCDDTVLRRTPARLQLVRRSRGYAPEPLPLLTKARRHVLAVGAELKNTVAVAKDTMVVASHHLGDLEHPATSSAFFQAIHHLCHLYGVTPEVVAHDLHPEYLSTKWALDADLPTLGVQHHHAHVASCLAEHEFAGPVLGVAFDGLGLGLDGTLWGGEFLVADLSRFERVGHLRAVPLPGGAAAIRQPWRMAVAWASQALGADDAALVGADLDDRWPAVLGLVHSGGPHAPLTTSAGRLFDAASALLGVRRTVSYEGQAAIELEALARTIALEEAPDYGPLEVDRSEGQAVLDPGALVARVVEERRRGTAAPVVAAGFHRALGEATADLAASLAEEHGLATVALSGGVFQNARLTQVVEDGLRRRGFAVLVHSAVPPNDGGISIGQAAVAAVGDYEG